MTERANIPEKTLQAQRRYLVMASACVVLAALAAAVLVLPELPVADAGGAGGAAAAGMTASDALGAGAAGALGVAACPQWLYLVGTCVLVAVVEELVFRGLLLRAVRRACGPKATIVVTAAVFAALHGLPIGIEGAPAAEVVAASLALKFLEALAFGIVLAALLFRGGTLPLVIALHAVFDIIYFAGPVLIGGDFPATYVATTPAGFASLAAATLILAIPAVRALRFPTSSLKLD
ncbi:CPBP family intramembrane glutamic endopeptidase [uncultured Adlercreutzia sp.]|uniref:CPBP family intramembrane glutamic endopeptidase n=1 Tax=uncultured Adlercreutzia sp. TaxID=875803 RepID=UPI0026752B61|nr:CPBP family intramembrane glutamic endopeptidase [uncultured Adlercreutzia sp.]